MCLYYDLCDILFENRKQINDGIYIECMKILNEDYHNNHSYIFARFLLKNEEKFDNKILKIMFTRILEHLDRTHGEIILQEKGMKEKIIHEFIIFFSLFSIHVGFFYLIFLFIIYKINNEIIF
jgi:hypothetical protein